MKINLHDKLRSINYKQYRKAIECSEGICLNLERHLNTPDKIKIFALIERSIVGAFLEFAEKEKEWQDAKTFRVADMNKDVAQTLTKTGAN